MGGYEVNLDTPEGALHVSWSAPPRIYMGLDPLDPGHEDPLAVRQEPLATLNGVIISVDRATEILRAMSSPDLEADS